MSNVQELLRQIKDEENERRSVVGAVGIPEGVGTVRDVETCPPQAETKEPCCQGQGRPNDTYDRDYYRRGGVECIEAISSAIRDRQGEEAFLIAQCIKYLWRVGRKGSDPVEDLGKTSWYLNRLTGIYRGRKNGSTNTA